MPHPVICFAAALISLLNSTAVSHPELLLQIDELTTQIVQQPTSGVLYLRRAQLYSMHSEYARALADFTQAERTGADEAGVRLARGKMYLQAGRLPEAQVELDALLASSPRLPAAHLERARLFEQSGQSLSAADEYTSAIDLDEAPRPETYLSRAECMYNAGKKKESIAGLDAAERRVGALVALRMKAAELEERAGDFSAAAIRLKKIADTAARGESYLVRAAELYNDAGQTSASLAAANQAMQQIARLPRRIQGTSATQSLLQRLRSLHIAP